MPALGWTSGTGSPGVLQAARTLLVMQVGRIEEYFHEFLLSQIRTVTGT